MASLIEQIEEFFERDGWPVDRIEDETILHLGFRSEDTPNMWSCYAQTIEEDNQFIFYSAAPVEPQPEQFSAVAEYITRANYGLVLGNFEMDLESGMVRFKTSIDVEDDRLSYELWRPIVYANVYLMERYLPGLQAVVYEQMDPAEAIERTEAAE